MAKIDKNDLVLIVTSMGNISIILYEDTPAHKLNFLKLVEDNFYDNILFHRVIPNFMIQAGDPDSKSAIPGQRLGSGSPGHTIPAEFRPALFHKKGSVAAARLPDNVNQGKESSGSQFYIVQGEVYSPAQLDSLVNKGYHKPFSEEEKRIYTSIGGTPFLDGSYTVFGEVVEGLEVVEKIASVATDTNNRPVSDVKIIKVSLEK
jgi:cyclophilin family peptidyl-prolyl cis-trans isomerase